MTTIFVYLLDEGTDVWRPVEAVKVGPAEYRIVGVNNASDDEHWQFATGDVVQCEIRTLSGGDSLVAVAVVGSVE